MSDPNETPEENEAPASLPRDADPHYERVRPESFAPPRHFYPRRPSPTR